MMGKLAVKPVIGSMIRKSLERHYRYIHTNSVVVPIEVAKDIIRNTTDIAVSPCVCRTVQGHCDNPINICFGLNFYGQLKKKAGERSVSVDECLAVADMAHKNGLIAVIDVSGQSLLLLHLLLKVPPSFSETAFVLFLGFLFFFLSIFMGTVYRSVVHLLPKAKMPSTKQAEKYRKTLDFKRNRVFLVEISGIEPLTS